MLEINDDEKGNVSSLEFIDLFAGIGGFHYAMSSFGARCVFASEWDNHAATVYENNFGIYPAGDITIVDEKKIPNHDVICGGFPCQAFSISGNQKGFEDTRGTLFFDILRIANYHKPKLLFLENVKNLVRHDNGTTLSTIIDNLEKIGYDVNYKILNTSNFGLPQNRERVYFVCFRKDLGIKNFQFPKPIKSVVRLEDVLDTNVGEDFFINRSDVVMKEDDVVRYDMFDEPIRRNRPLQIGYVNKGGQGERIYHPSGHAITLSAYGGGPGGKTGIYLFQGRMRKLTQRECARVQGFPESFTYHERKNQAYKQFGNSVSINVLQHILKQIANVL